VRHFDIFVGLNNGNLKIADAIVSSLGLVFLVFAFIFAVAVLAPAGPNMGSATEGPSAKLAGLGLGFRV